MGRWRGVGWVGWGRVRESGIVEVEGGRGRGEVTAWILQCCTIAPCFFTSSEGWHTLMGQTRKWRWWWRSGGWKRLSRIWTPKVLTLTHYLKHRPTPPPWPETYHSHESCHSNSRGGSRRRGSGGNGMEWGEERRILHRFFTIVTVHLIFSPHLKGKILIPTHTEGHEGVMVCACGCVCLWGGSYPGFEPPKVLTLTH